MNILTGLRQAESTAKEKAMERAMGEVANDSWLLSIDSCEWMPVADMFRIRIGARHPQDGRIEQEFESWIESPVYRQVLAALEISEDDWQAILDGLLTTYQLTIYA